MDLKTAAFSIIYNTSDGFIVKIITFLEYCPFITAFAAILKIFYIKFYTIRHNHSHQRLLHHIFSHNILKQPTQCQYLHFLSQLCTICSCMSLSSILTKTIDIFIPETKLFSLFGQSAAAIFIKNVILFKLKKNKFTF